MEEADFTNSGDNGSKEGIKDVESESKRQKPCNLQPKLDNAFVKTEIKMEDDYIYEFASENHSIGEGGNWTAGIERNGHEPLYNLQGVLDNKIAKPEITMEDDGIPNSSTESGAKSLKSRLLLNKIVPEHAGRKHKATTDEMPTEKETTKNGWTKLNNVLFKDGILIDDTDFLPSFIQSALIQKSGQPNIINEKSNTVDAGKNIQETFESSEIEMRNVVVMQEKITVDDTFYCNSAIQSGFKNNAETNENSFNKERREFVRKETVKVDNIGNNVQGRFQNPGIKTDIKIMMQCSVSVERLPSIEKYGREASQGPNLESGHLVAIKDTVKEECIGKNGQYHIKDPEVESAIQIVSKCSVSLERLPSIEKYKCHKMFDSGVALQNHLKTNHFQELNKHLSIHMDKNVHNCSVCHKSFIDHKSLLRHKLKHQFTNSYKCIHCNKSYETIVHLKKHLLSHDARSVESEKAWSDEEVPTEEFQDLSDECIDVDQDFSDEDDQPLSLLAKHNPLKYRVKNKARSGKQVSTELEFQDIFLTENNGQNRSEYRIKNSKVSVSNTSTDVIFHNLSDKYGNVNQQISVLIDTNRNNRSKNKEVTDHSSAESDEDIFNDAEFHQDVNVDTNVSKSENLQQNYMRIGSGNMFTTTKEMKKHEITPKKYECDLCENVFSQYSKYQQHLVYHIDGDKLKCLHCKKLFDSGVALKCHMQTRNCKQCRKCLPSSAALEQHMQFIHSGIHPYKCTKCDEGFLLSEELKKHSLSHTKKKLHTCPVCYKSFSKSGYVERHFLTHSDKRDYKCTKCSKSFKTSQDLNSHMLLHSGVKNHICSICSKAFLRRSALKKHLRTHTGIQPHKCPLCDKRFSHIKRVKRHLVIIHYGKKEHKCIHCNECFALFPDLERHYATHNDPRPSKCKECPKSFVKKRHLTTHMLSHSGVKPHQCVQCGTSFRLPHHLRNHLLTHSAKKRPKRK